MIFLKNFIKYILINLLLVNTLLAQDLNIHGKLVNIDTYTPSIYLNSYVKKAFKYVYTTESDNNQIVTASSLIFEPPEPNGNIVLFAHPTVGINLECGLSNSWYIYLFESFVKDLLKENYIVVVPDYRGLGESNTLHRYLNADDSAKDILDALMSIMEGQKIPFDNQIVLWGYSQGGQATQRAIEITQKYSTKLNIIASIQNSPVSLLSPFLNEFISNKINLLHFADLPIIISGIVRSNSNVSFNDFFDSSFLENNEKGINLGCKSNVIKSLIISNNIFGTIKPTDKGISYLKRYFQNNDLPKDKSDIPILLLRGDNDYVINPKIQEEFKKRLCKNKFKVQEIIRKGFHVSFFKDQEIVIPWIKDRFNNKPIINDCK